MVWRKDISLAPLNQHKYAYLTAKNVPVDEKSLRGFVIFMQPDMIMWIPRGFALGSVG